MVKMIKREEGGSKQGRKEGRKKRWHKNNHNSMFIKSSKPIYTSLESQEAGDKDEMIKRWRGDKKEIIKRWRIK